MFETKSYKIVQEPKTNSYILTLKNGSTQALYKSISETNILSNVFFDDTNNVETIMFTAEKVKPISILLKESKLTNQQITKMIYDLSKQIAYLEINMMSFYGYNLDYILVINDNTFFVASTKHLTNINAKDYYIYFYKPIVKPYFSSPELNAKKHESISSLYPAMIHIKSVFLSVKFSLMVSIHSFEKLSLFSALPRE